MKHFFYIVNALILHIMGKKGKSLPEMQLRVLLNKIKLSNNSKQGIRYGFSTIRSISEYQKKVPVHHYEDLKEYWQGEAHGEVGESLNDKVKRFGMSSGTTGQRKLIPVTSELLVDNRRAHFHFISLYLQMHRYSNLLVSKKYLGIVGPAELEKNEYGASIGLISGIMRETTPSIFARKAFPTMKTVNISAWDEKVKSMADEIRNQPIGLIAGIPAPVVDFLTRLKAIYSIDEFEKLADSLELFIFTGVNYRMYEEPLAKLLGKRVNIVEGYAATEGIFGHQSPTIEGAMEFFPQNIFYEFISFEEYQNKNYENRKLMWQLEEGQEYVILVTSGTGAFSYVIGDVIECVNQTIPAFKIKGRTSLTLNLGGEKCSMASVEKAAATVSAELGDCLGEFFVTGKEVGGKPFHQWVFQENPLFDSLSPQKLGKMIDRVMRSQNTLFDQIYNINIFPSEVKVISKSAIFKWYSIKNANPGHCKIPRIILDEGIVDQLLEG